MAQTATAQDDPSFLDYALAPADIAASLAAQYGMQALGGIGGTLMTGLGLALPQVSKDQAVNAGVKTVENLQNMAYTPKSPVSQALLGYAGEKLAPAMDTYEKARRTAADPAAENFNSPALGAAVYTAPDVIMEALPITKILRAAGRGTRLDVPLEMGSVGSQATGMGKKERGAIGIPGVPLTKEERVELALNPQLKALWAQNKPKSELTKQRKFEEWLQKVPKEYQATQGKDLQYFIDTRDPSLPWEPIGTPPVNTREAYRLFRVNPKKPEHVSPMFVNRHHKYDMNEWIPAVAGELAKPTASGNPRVKAAGGGDLAFRPGHHAGLTPSAHHIGMKDPNFVGNIRKAPNAYRKPNEVWAQVDMADDVDWQAEAKRRLQFNKEKGAPMPDTMEIKEHAPYGGSYLYNTKADDRINDWVIAGDMLIKRILTDKDVAEINAREGVYDLPRQKGAPDPALDVLEFYERLAQKKREF